MKLIWEEKYISVVVSLSYSATSDVSMSFNIIMTGTWSFAPSTTYSFAIDIGLMSIYRKNDGFYIFVAVPADEGKNLFDFMAPRRLKVRRKWWKRKELSSHSEP